MALAWVELKREGGNPVFHVDTGGNHFFELFLTTQPELMLPRFAAQRSPDNFYSTRATEGRLMAAANGRALFPLPEILQRRFRDGNLYYMVKTYRDGSGAGPALSPVMEGNGRALPMAATDPTGEEVMPIDVKGALTSVMTPATSGAGPSVVDRTPPALRSQARAGQPAAATALALVAEQMRQQAVLDPRMPNPGIRPVVQVMTHVLSCLPAPPGAAPVGVSAASYMAGVISGGRPAADGQLALERAVLKSHDELTQKPYSHEQFWQFLLQLAPYLVQLLPTLLPLIQQLLGGASGSKGLGVADGAPGAGPSSTDTLLKLLAAMPPDKLAELMKVAGGTPAAPSPPAGGAPAGSTTAAPASPRGTAPPAAAPPAAGTGGQPAASMNPEQIQALLGALGGGSGGGGGLKSLLEPTGGIGGDLLKSVVDRLPIKEMFDPSRYIPVIDQNALLKMLPWDSILSLSDPTSAIGTVIVPGRRFLRKLPDGRLAITSRTATRLPGGQESWIFMAGSPIRLGLSVTAGGAGLSRPFIDVRVSRHGTAVSGIRRSVFRLRSLGPQERRQVDIELPPDVVATAPTGGKPTFLSIRLVEQGKDDTFSAVETRASFYVVHPHALILDEDATMGAAPELAGIPGLQTVLPAEVLTPQPRAIEWSIGLADSTEVTGDARWLPVRQRQVSGEVSLIGGLQISSVGLADLARRIPGNDLGAEAMVAFKAAVDTNPGLRQRIGLLAQEPVDAPLLARASNGLRVSVEMAVIPASLVTFDGVRRDGNPSTRTVTRMQIPVPRGLTLQAD